MGTGVQPDQATEEERATCCHGSRSGCKAGYDLAQMLLVIASEAKQSRAPRRIPGLLRRLRLLGRKWADCHQLGADVLTHFHPARVGVSPPVPTRNDDAHNWYVGWAKRLVRRSSKSEGGSVPTAAAARSNPPYGLGKQQVRSRKSKIAISRRRARCPGTVLPRPSDGCCRGTATGPRSTLARKLNRSRWRRAARR